MIKEVSTATHDSGCLMAMVNCPTWASVSEIIHPDHVYNPDNEHGIEDEPHCTILYGFLPGKASIQSFLPYLKVMKPFHIQLKGINCFNNEKYDVVKFQCESPVLHILNKVAKRLPHKSSFPTYEPHITIAYVKPGMGKYYGVNFKGNYYLPVSKFKFSHPDGTKENFNLK